MGTIRPVTDEHSYEHFSDGDREALSRSEFAVCVATFYEDIAERLTVSSHTVRNHVQRILMKLEAGSRLEAVAIAVRHGLISR